MKRWMVSCALLAVMVGCAATSDDAVENEATSDLSASSGTCTSTFGNAMVGSNGRLDGTVSAIVAPSKTHVCSADKDHVHVQVKVQGSVYDVAVNTNGVAMVEKDVATLPGGAWAEGWHRNAAVSYANDLGLHSTAFGAESNVSQEFMNDLASAQNVSVYGWPYSKGGIHLIHKSRKTPQDGAFVVQGANRAPSRLYAFKFDDQRF
jgi:hypothetical protein